MFRIGLLTLGFALCLPLALCAQEAEKKEETKADPARSIPSGMLSTMRLRSLGPALTSGRIGDFAVNPEKTSEYYAAACSGGLWKTTDGGVTFRPIFDSQGSYSIGCVTLDPNNPHTVWVGTGENNSQRSVAWGDGVYRSRDGGQNWEHLGLKRSEHIGDIVVHPYDADTVFVAAQGPLWRSGGDRGLYRTTDGGKNWKRVLHISDDTGVNEVHLDPRNPDVLYASAYQRRRRPWTLINGGPESGLYKSTDGGETWRKINRGLPGGDKGRIGLAVSPVNPDVLYAVVEAQGGGGLYRSTNRGESWTKRSSYMSSSPQYYNELVADPKDVDRLYALDTVLKISEDGGRTMNSVPISGKHVDDHALWIDPKDTDHLLCGCDGGIYETWNRGSSWQFKPNLPITQFYKVALDNAEPFYHIYGGTQDNNTLGGPVATIRNEGILNEDWFVTVGGDGFEPAVDPTNPNIVYSQWQYGGLVRHDRLTGETVDIKPQGKPGDDPERWNWDTALTISPHAPSRLYYCSQRVWRSEDRGNSWIPISPDLTRQIDRNRLKVMGKIQKVDAVAKNKSTSFYGTIVAISESPMVEGLIYIGTDDGLIQVSEDGGESWRKLDSFSGVPDETYVSCLVTSRHDADRVYACFDNHKNGDFKPYVVVSEDRGRTWKTAMGDLPGLNVCYSLAEDHEDPELLFVGTEFGAYVTVTRGESWKKLSGLPNISVRDVEIQRRENDLVVATFGRGFYVLDNYAPLRHRALAAKKAAVFPVKPALRYVRTSRGRGSLGASFYRAKNPAYGAVFTWWMAEGLSGLKSARKKKEKDPDYYPSWEELRAEDAEGERYALLTIRDDAGVVVRRLRTSAGKGTKRTTWDLRYASPSSSTRGGMLALPGRYTVEISTVNEGKVTTLGEPRAFEVRPLDIGSIVAKNRKADLQFYQRAARLVRLVRAASSSLGTAQKNLATMTKTLLGTPKADLKWLERAESLRREMIEIDRVLNGDDTLSARSAPTPTSISGRASLAIRGLGRTTQPPTETWKRGHEEAKAELAKIYPRLKEIIETELPAMRAALVAADGAWIEGSLPAWDGR
jgi:photosystem II stability/assembly factor-like uncharacterized protein